MKRPVLSLTLYCRSQGSEQVSGDHVTWHSTPHISVLLLSLDTCYCIALCHYMMKQYTNALKFISDVIERGIREHPG